MVATPPRQTFPTSPTARLRITPEIILGFLGIADCNELLAVSIGTLGDLDLIIRGPDLPAYAEGGAPYTVSLVLENREGDGTWAHWSHKPEKKWRIK